MVRACRIPAILLMTLAVTLIHGAAEAAAISAFVDRDPVPLDESFHLTYEVAGAADAEPDFTPLNRDFDILNRAQSSNLSIINGQFNRKTQWKLTLMARKTGKMTIPAIAFGRDHSPEVQVTVIRGGGTSRGARASRDLFLEVEAAPRKAYVQAQVILKVRLFRAVEIANGTLTEPETAGGEAVIEKLGEDRHYVTRRGGRRYNVIERRYAVFPQKSGALTIKPLVFNGQIIQATSGGLFFDPFNPSSDPFNRSSRTRRLRSPRVKIQVEPIPAAWRSGAWLPADDLQLKEQWSPDPPRFSAGEPVTRTLEIKARGLSAAQLPALSSSTPDALKQYPDQPVLNDKKEEDGITGIRQEKVAFIPARPGDYTLPAIDIPWWNTATQKIEIAHLAERRVHVVPAAGTAPPPQAASLAPGAQPVSPLEVNPSPSAGAQPAASSRRAPSSGTVVTSPSWTGTVLWPWLSLFLAVGWAITAIVWWKARPARKAPSAPGREERNASVKEARKRLRQACIQNDYGVAKDALLAWGRARWPHQAPRNLGDIGRRCCGAALREEIGRLSQALYRDGSTGWEGKMLWEAFRNDRITAEEGAQPHRSTEGVLEPLYRA